MLGDLREVFFCLQMLSFIEIIVVLVMRSKFVTAKYLGCTTLYVLSIAIFLNLLNARWGRIFNIHLTTNLPRNLPVKKI